jgi:hypothetical protein
MRISEDASDAAGCSRCRRSQLLNNENSKFEFLKIDEGYTKK